MTEKKKSVKIDKGLHRRIRLFIAQSENRDLTIQSFVAEAIKNHLVEVGNK